ncbi:hypothetical protein AMECASPLE_001491 [Ameca splendens]|uniref:Uncharacterized protein n=1 Tax=Ameca splendens TaxID=208324 RepID=A0ABV0XA04_9TELE
MYSSTGGTDSGSTHGVQQGGHEHSQQAAPGDGSAQFAEESWSSSSDTNGEDEPVFSPVDEEDQVYAYKSKSRYNRIYFGDFWCPSAVVTGRREGADSGEDPSFSPGNTETSQKNNYTCI